MVVDPYQTLGLPHSASAIEIKQAYHRLARKCHPDKFVLCESKEEKNAAAKKFAECAAAYALLSNPDRKAEYDHVYKYGGYDSEEPCEPAESRKRRSFDSTELGVGYTCIDPFAVLYTQGRIQTKQAVCGVQIPQRFHSAGSIRFAFSSGNVVRGAKGITKCTSRTTKFAHGRKSTRTETVTYHPSGLKEVLIEGDGGEEGFQRQYYSEYTNVSRQKEHHLPWYVQAWKEIREKLTVCYSPCATQQAH